MLDQSIETEVLGCHLMLSCIFLLACNSQILDKTLSVVVKLALQIPEYK